VRAAAGTVKLFAKAIALFSVGSFIGTATQLAKGKLGALLLGTEGVGVLNQLTNAWSLLYSISGLGFYNGIVRSVADAIVRDDNEELARRFSSALIFLTAFSCTTAAACILLSAQIANWIFGDGGDRAWFVAITLFSVPMAIVAQTYKGLLSGSRLVRPIVAAQIISDVAGIVVFAILIAGWGLIGAVASFSLIQLLKLLIQLRCVARSFHRVRLAPSWSEFRWSEVAPHVGYGANGLVTTSLATLTILLISRWIIDGEGLHGNGVFSVAWKVASLYFGALYATAGSYYFPTLVGCKNDAELGKEVNEALALYFYVIPPVIAALMVFGDVLMRVLFSEEFVPAAFLLVFLLSGDIFRIVSEALGMPFLARRRLLPYTCTYVAWSILFAGLAWFALPRFGLPGVAGAYLVSQAINALVVTLCARRVFAFSFSTHTIRVLTAGSILVATTAAVSVALQQSQARYLLGAALAACWLFVSWRDEAFRSLARAAAKKLRKRVST
jgi:O-antigen/teichoic acid export membrane protein